MLDICKINKKNYILIKTNLILINVDFTVKYNFLAQFEHTTYDYVLDNYKICVRDSNDLCYKK